LKILNYQNQGGNFAAVTEEQDLAPMLNKIWNYSKLYTRCLLTTQVALKISVLTFQLYPADSITGRRSQLK
jgi:hypothetical protein